MNRLIYLDFLREIKKTIGRFLSIFFIVLVGAGFFAGVKAAVPDMQYTADVFYDQCNLYDLRVLSTMGLTEDDIEAIQNVEGVKDVEPSYFADAVSRIGTRDVVFRVHSVPERMNQLILTSGRLPESPDECVVEDSINIDTPAKIGEIIYLTSGSEYKKLSEQLSRRSFKVVGTVRSADYITYQKGYTELGSGMIDYFMLVPPENFTFPVYVEALVSVDGAIELSSFSKAYIEKVDKVKNFVENIAADRVIDRAEEMKKEAEKELKKGKRQLKDQERKFNREIAAAEKEIQEAQDKLVSGEATLKSEQENFARMRQQALRQIAEGERELAAAERQYNETLALYRDAMSEYGGLIDGIRRVTGDVQSLYNDAVYQKGQLENELNDPNLSDEDRVNKQVLLDGYSMLISMIDETYARTGDLGGIVGSAVGNVEQQLASAEQQLYDGRNKLNQARAELFAATNQAEAKFAAARAELDEGWAQLEEGKKELAENKAEGEKLLREAREKIIRAEGEIERLSSPRWYVLDRDANVGLMTYKNTTEKVNALASIFPVFFILVAGLVCLTSMTRMVDEQRTVIGIYKALGYSTIATSFKFVVYAAIASFFGAIVGVALGMSFFPEAIFNAWSMMFIIPTFYSTTHWPLVFVSVIVASLSMMGVAYYATRNELNATAATLMRPKAPTAGKMILLERIESFWKRLTFMQKVTTRNIFRYKKRFWMTVAGILGCAALLLAGLGISDSVSHVVERQYEEIFNYEMMVLISPDADVDKAKSKLENQLNELNGISSWNRISYINVEVQGEKDALPVALIIPEDTSTISDYIRLRDYSNQSPLSLDEGVVISEKLARLLGVKPGDYIQTTIRGITKNVQVSGITEQYVFHYMYMAPEYYTDLLRFEPVFKEYLVKTDEGADEKPISDLILEDKNISSVVIFSNLAEDFSEQVSSLNSIVLLIIISAGILAFVVLYNLININISERIREIATIKVLGFYDTEVYSYVFREISILSLLGTALGLVAGIGLHKIVMVAIEQEDIMFGYTIDPSSFVYACLLTIFFTILVNLFMIRRLRGIPMVESLKSIE